ncbi:transcriptional regulator [Aliivibrio wodanis]|uniref:Transcriptional regulator n=1 Tax=Aliivibrio wodanis TaxID=80852 RepID=A0A090K1H4_9GAMM|nr:transcriptional regulator [Aliivibrio wodanis]
MTYKIDDLFFIPYDNKLTINKTDIVIDNRLSNLLLFLCDNPNIIFSRDELIDKVWHGSIVTDQVITQSIFELRKILKQHGQHSDGYIITVPKRGYKLDATVAIVNAKSRAQQLHDDNDIKLYNPDLNYPLPKDKVTLNNIKHLLISTALIFALVSIIYSHDYVSTSKINENYYLSLEPRYIHIVMQPEIKNNSLLIGVIEKTLEYLKYYKDFRIIYNGSYQKLSANKITFSSSNNNGINYLHVEYINNISNKKTLDRKYPISKGFIKDSIGKLLRDLLYSFNIDIRKSDISKLTNELPDKPSSVINILASIGGLYVNDKHSETLRVINLAAQESPKNPYAVATSYIFHLSILYTKENMNNPVKIKELNTTTAKKFEYFIENKINTPRLLEAMAMMALSEGNPLNAKAFLNKIPYKRKTVLSYILHAKISESIGNNAAAEEYYYQAIIESPSPQVLTLTESLFFNSNISHIKKN